KPAVVLIPPEDVWEPIQAIRREHDRKVRRWMPHVTLLYPFRPYEEFDAAAKDLAVACRSVEPFEVSLEEIRWFSHGRQRFTMWLSPEPAEKLIELHEALWRTAPDCNHVRRHAVGFMPHLSVGQVSDRWRLDRLIATIQANWRPVRFRATAVSLIRRDDPPNDVFRVDRLLPLGASRDE
ncbi:MAG: 2'-5' RNA ligase family protein, partial [Phycisphaerae bacterium]